MLYRVWWGMLHELWSRGMSGESSKFWLEDKSILHVLVCSANEHCWICVVLIQIDIFLVWLFVIFTFSIFFTLWFLLFRIMAYNNLFRRFSAARRSPWWPKHPQYRIVPKDILKPSRKNCPKWLCIFVFDDIAFIIACKKKYERVQRLICDLKWYCTDYEPQITQRFIACFDLFFYSTDRHVCFIFNQGFLTIIVFSDWFGYSKPNYNEDSVHNLVDSIGQDKVGSMT